MPADGRFALVLHVPGAIYFIQQHLGCSVLGADLFIASNLPPNKGVSSSAALEVATLKAVAAAWSIGLDGISLATAAQWVENTLVGAACKRRFAPTVLPVRSMEMTL